MANARKRGDNNTKPIRPIFLLTSAAALFLLLIFFFIFLIRNPSPTSPIINPIVTDLPIRRGPITHGPIAPFDCDSSPQSHPVIANVVEGLKYPFLYSLADLGKLPEKPNKNVVRVMKGKPFRRPDISETIQEVLGEFRSKGKRDGVVVNVGGNVGIASFAAAVMGYKVVAFEPVLENLQRICDLVGRLDNSAVSASGAKLAFKSNEEVAVQVRTVPLDDVIPESEPVLVIKIDVQGWEYHVLKGAKNLLSRKASEVPYLIYEEDEHLLQASNTSKVEIRKFLSSVGYRHCTHHGTDAHCTKEG